MKKVLIQSNSLMYKRYRKTILSNITIRLDEGELLLISGPPASGKSIFIELLSGVRKPSDGSLIMLDNNIMKNEMPNFAQIKCAWQKPALYLTMSLEKNLWFFSKIYGFKNKRAKKDMVDLMKSFELFEKRRQFITTLSLGEQKKADLCRVLMGKSQILLLDEPMAMLGRSSIDILKEILLQKKKEGSCIIIATNNADPISDLVDKVLVLKKGSPIMYQKKDVILGRRENVVVLETKKDVDIVKIKRIRCLKAVKRAGKYYHLWLKENVTLSNLTKALESEQIEFKLLKTEQESLQTVIEEVVSNA